MLQAFDIVTAIESSATTNGWEFEFAIDDRSQEFNIAVCRDLTAGQNILLFAFRMLPDYSGSSVNQRTYSCLIMLGRKFDPSGLASSLDETSKQKYDRRLFELQTELELFIGAFACDNNLTMIPSQFSFAKNMYDTNIDFVMTSNVQFIQ